MLPIDIIRKAEQLRHIKEGRRRILIGEGDWLALCDYLAELEPITQWPRPEREPVTRLEIYGIPVEIAHWQYFCRRCGNERQGVLDMPTGIGGYAWACPECGSHDIDSKPAEPKEPNPGT